MTQHGTDFFDNVGSPGAPSAQLSGVGDFVYGTIEHFSKRDYVAYKKKEPERAPDGSIAQQLVIILQTDQRNWVGVKKVPFIDRDDESKGHKPPSEDDGRRAVYIPPNKNIQFAVHRAIVASKDPFVIGGTLGVKIVGLKDTGQGEPMRVHRSLLQGAGRVDRLLPPDPAAGGPCWTRSPGPGADSHRRGTPCASSSGPACCGPSGRPVGGLAGADDRPAVLTDGNRTSCAPDPGEGVGRTALSGGETWHARRSAHARRAADTQPCPADSSASGMRSCESPATSRPGTLEGDWPNMSAI